MCSVQYLSGARIRVAVMCLLVPALATCESTGLDEVECLFPERCYSATILGDYYSGVLNNVGQALLLDSLYGTSFLRSPDGTLTEVPLHTPRYGHFFNDLGQVLGAGGGPDWQTQVWAGGNLRDLGQVSAVALNNAGDVLLSDEGVWFIDGGGDRTPITLPSSITPWYLDLRFLTTDGRIAGEFGPSWDMARCFILDPSTDQVMILEYECVFSDLDPDGEWALTTNPGNKYLPGGGWELWYHGAPVSFGGPGSRPAWRRPIAVARGGLSVGFAAESWDWNAVRMAWLVDPPHEYRLDTLIEDQAWLLTEVFDVNDRGQVLARGVHRDTEEETMLLLDPVNEGEP